MPKQKKYTVPAPLETIEQQCVVGWASNQIHIYPELEWLYAIPNGGHRSIKTAVQLRKEGVKPGVSDLCLPAARGNFHGLYIEMKRISGGRESEDQKKFREFVTAQGYLAVVCKGAGEAIETIKNYLKPPTVRELMEDIVQKNERCVYGRWNAFLSIEPLLEPLNFKYSHFDGIRWVIIGAESGNRKDKVIPEKAWIDDIVNECQKNDMPVFMKDSLIPIVGEENMRREFPWEAKK
ncbi:MAG: DUF5131 family protein [Oscillospiraceae bacterium]